MKILFVWPNKESLGIKPLGISLLISICHLHGHEIDLFETTYIDLGFKSNKEVLEEMFVFKPVEVSSVNLVKEKDSLDDSFLEKLKSFDPDIVAFTVLSDEVLIARTCSETAKRWKSSVITIWGGKYPTVCPEETLGMECVDFICVSEGLEAFPEWLRQVESGGDPHSIQNIWTTYNGRIIKNPIRPLMQDLDSLPFMNWEYFDERNFIKIYDGNVYRGGDWMSNWGCVHECAYCINKYLHELHGKKGFIRRYTPKRAIQELSYLKNTYKLTFLKFHDEDFLMRDVRSLEEFSELYKKEIGLPFVIETNPLSVTEHKAKLLRDMNCVSASLGVEAGNDHVRKNILNRNETRKDVIKAFMILNDAGIRSVAFLMLGLPFDTREKIHDSIELMREANVRVSNVGIFFPFEKTEIRRVCIENGIYNPSDFPFYTSDVPALDQKTLSRQELMALRRTFNLYVKLPKSFWPFIERSEKGDQTGMEIFQILKDIFISHVRDQGDYFRELNL